MTPLSPSHGRRSHLKKRIAASSAAVMVLASVATYAAAAVAPRYPAKPIRIVMRKAIRTAGVRPD